MEVGPVWLDKLQDFWAACLPLLLLFCLNLLSLLLPSCFHILLTVMLALINHIPGFSRACELFTLEHLGCPGHSAQWLRGLARALPIPTIRREQKGEGKLTNSGLQVPWHSASLASAPGSLNGCWSGCHWLHCLIGIWSMKTKFLRKPDLQLETKPPSSPQPTPNSDQGYLEKQRQVKSLIIGAKFIGLAQ